LRQNLTPSLRLYIVFEFEVEYEAAIYFSQQRASEHAGGLSDTSFVYGSDLVAEST
jgi:hypothetical protein